MSELENAIDRLGRAIASLRSTSGGSPASGEIDQIAGERDELAAEVVELRARRDEDARLRAEAADAVRIALTDLAAGTLVTPEQFAASGLIEPGEGIVGLALDPGEYPSLSIQPGDVVSVVQVPRASDTGESDELVLVVEAEVVDVGPIGVQNQLFISLSTTRESAGEVAAAAAQDRVRLIQVGSE